MCLRLCWLIGRLSGRFLFRGSLWLLRLCALLTATGLIGAALIHLHLTTTLKEKKRMAEHAKIQETMQAVMQAQEIVATFHRNVADLFRTVLADAEELEPAYEGLMDDGELLTSSINAHVKGSSSWITKHLALALAPEEEEGPVLLVHVSTDGSFHDTPEVWLGVLSELQSFQGDKEDAVSYIFQDYFGPEDEWTEAKKWYSLSFDDDEVAVKMSFYRFPLALLTDREAIRTEVIAPLRSQMGDLA